MLESNDLTVRICYQCKIHSFLQRESMIKGEGKRTGWGESRGQYRYLGGGFDFKTC